MGSISELQSSGLSTDFQWGLNPGFGWASQVHTETKPLHCCLGCAIWVNIPLVGESPPSSEVISTLKQVFVLFIIPIVNQTLQWHDLVATLHVHQKIKTAYLQKYPNLENCLYVYLHAISHFINCNKPELLHIREPHTTPY